MLPRFIFVPRPGPGPLSCLLLPRTLDSQTTMGDSSLPVWLMASSFSRAQGQKLAQEGSAYQPPEVFPVDIRPPGPGGHLEQAYFCPFAFYTL